MSWLRFEKVKPFVAINTISACVVCTCGSYMKWMFDEHTTIIEERIRLTRKHRAILEQRLKIEKQRTDLEEHRAQTMKVNPNIYYHPQYDLVETQ